MPGGTGVRSTSGGESSRRRRGLSFRFVGEAISELRRVTWPTREEATRLTIMVLAVSAAVGVFLGIIDLIFSRLFDVILAG
jgi:preprotein translocase subunit SecE